MYLYAYFRAQWNQRHIEVNSISGFRLTKLFFLSTNNIKGKEITTNYWLL